MYLYGVSYGGIMQTNYFIKDNANNPYSGMVAYGAAAFNLVEDIEVFEKRAFGMYNFALGLERTNEARALMDDLAKYTPKEKIERYRSGLPKKFLDASLTTFDDTFMAPMFGFKGKVQYYSEATSRGKLHNITRCPVMFLGAWDDILT